ncbi:hypothetical protein ACHQM5_012177 [Ranunculus cassubicifolius]
MSMSIGRRIIASYRNSQVFTGRRRATSSRPAPAPKPNITQFNQVDNISDKIPFEIEDNRGEPFIYLKRVFHGEVIQVKVEMPSKSDCKPHQLSRMPLFFTASKGTNKTLEYSCSVYELKDRFSVKIDNIDVREDVHTLGGNQFITKRAPSIWRYPRDVTIAMEKYLEIRGVDEISARILFDYMKKKSIRVQ